MIRRATELLGERRVNEPSFFNSTTSTLLVRITRRCVKQ